MYELYVSLRSIILPLVPLRSRTVIMKPDVKIWGDDAEEETCEMLEYKS